MKAQTQLVPSRLAQLSKGQGGLRGARRPGAGGLLLASLLSVVGCGSPEPEVEPGSPLALAVYPSHPRVPQDTEEQLRIVGTFADGTTRDLSKQARWSAQAVGGGAVAMLAPGLLPASQPGQLQVTVQYGDTQLQVPVEVSAVTFKSLAVSPSGPVFAKGTTQQLAATGTYSDGSTKDLTTQVSWSVMDVTGSGVVSVDGKGLLLGKSVGKAEVSARYRTKTATTTAEVTAAALTGLAVSPSSPSIAKGTSQAFKAMGTFTDGSTQEIPSGVTWSIADLIGSGSSAAEVVAACLKAGTLTSASADIIISQAGKGQKAEIVTVYSADSEERALAWTFQPMADGGTVVLVEDITARRNAEARIGHMARFDELTGLPNRVHFRDEIEEMLSSKDANEWMQAHAARLESEFFSLTTTLLRQLPVRL